MPTSTRWIVSATTVLTFAAAAAAGEPYRDAAGRFTLTLPHDWQVMPAEEVSQLNGALEALRPGRALRYTAGFRRRSDEPFTTPYLLLRVLPGRALGATHDEVRANLGRQFKENPDEMGNPVVTPQRDAFEFQFRAVTPHITRARGSAFGHLGSESTVILYGHSSEDVREFAADERTFSQIDETFRFDDGCTFTPAPGPLDVVDRFLHRTEYLIVAPLLGLVLVIVVASARAALRSPYAR
jgi:hypothetical protein